DVSDALAAARPTLPELDGTLAGERRPQVAYAAELTESEIEAVRSRYIRRVAALIVVMLLLIGGAWYGIYNYLGVKATTEAGFRFTNLAQVSQRDRQIVQENQLKLLVDDFTRQAAVKQMRAEFTP